MITPTQNLDTFLDTFLYNGTIPHVQGSQTSELAAESMEKSIVGLRRDVLDCVSARPDGATCDEVEQILSMRHQTASARCRELVLMGKLERRLDPTTGREIRSAQPRCCSLPHCPRKTALASSRPAPVMISTDDKQSPRLGPPAAPGNTHRPQGATVPGLPSRP